MIVLKSRKVELWRVPLPGQYPFPDVHDINFSLFRFFFSNPIYQLHLFVESQLEMIFYLLKIKIVDFFQMSTERF